MSKIVEHTQSACDTAWKGSQDPVARMTDAELERHIKDCGQHMVVAYAQGDRPAALKWMQLQAEAIAGRSPAQVAQMESCYFAERGASDRAALEVRG